MGDAIASLREEFPDLTASKLRYLESEGLIRPQRTARGSRRFSPDDLSELRRILRLQRDEYLPLRIIKEQLAKPARQVGGSATVRPEDLRPRRARAVSPAEMCERAGISRATFDELERFGLITAHDAEALTVCTLVASLQEFGIEPRHLRAFRVAADREIGLVQQAMAPHGGITAAAGAAEREMAGRLAALLTDLHVTLVRAGLPR